ncbi:MAG: hypothetical protein NC416_11125 [Eubacterium sp.]|nr:hypothetical protein [Eubacterium sp.]
MVLEEMNNAEIIQRGIEDFREVQRYMLLARKEHATNKVPRQGGIALY